MTQAQSAPATGPAVRGRFRAGWPSLLFALGVALAAVYSFSPRPLPEFPPTRLQASQMLVTSVQPVASGLVAVGDRGRILRASGVKGPWQQAEQNSARGSTLTRVLALDDGSLLAAGHDLWILRSEDEGKRWQEVHFAPDTPEPFLGLHQAASGRVFAFGGFGQFHVSDDGGRSWQRQRHEAIADYHLNAMAEAPDGTLMLAGERGLLLVSRDGGDSWQALDSGYAGSLFTVLWLAPDRWLAAGMRGTVLESSDDGASWQPLETPGSDSIFTAARLDDGRVVLAGAMHSVLLSDPGVARFQSIGPSRQGTLAAVLPLDDDRLLLAGEKGVLHLDLPARGAAR